MDKETIIKGCENWVNNHEGQNYLLTYSSVIELLAVLKEQEAVKPKKIDGKRNHFIKCGNCNYDLVTGFQFCPHCGKAVKWE